MSIDRFGNLLDDGFACNRVIEDGYDYVNPYGFFCDLCWKREFEYSDADAADSDALEEIC